MYNNSKPYQQLFDAAGAAQQYTP